MIILIAPDSFKECLSAPEVCSAMARGVRLIAPDADVVELPMADGGEGTVNALVAATGGRTVEVEVCGPLGGRVRASFGLLGDGSAAVIEMASASGLSLVPVGKRDPLKATTYGTGELIRAALDSGARHIIVGLGGSATVDGGAGMAQALGAELLDGSGNPIAVGGGSLGDLADIRLDKLDRRIAECRIEAACDVDNPLTGPQGAARVYGPQKGATPETVEALDANLSRLAAVIESDLGVDVSSLPGAGAAGGLGAGMMAFLGAELRPGAELVMNAVGLREKLKGADLVLTGEGMIDGQTARGKVIAAVAKAAKAAGVRAIALVGQVGDGAEDVLKVGLTEYRCIADRPMSREEAFARCPELLERAAADVVELLVNADRHR